MAWSPQQIAQRLRLDFPGDNSMRISHEAIYQALYVQGRGALKRELTACLRTEMAQHARLRVDTGLAIYFCDPHSPWQRGTNENTNGLLRQYFPRGTHLGTYGPDELAAVAATLNGRPRKTLGWRTPAEALDAVLQSGQAGVATTG